MLLEEQKEMQVLVVAIMEELLQAIPIIQMVEEEAEVAM